MISLEELQKRHMIRVLERVGGNKSQAAEILGVSRATIYQLLGQLKTPEQCVAFTGSGASHKRITPPLVIPKPGLSARNLLVAGSKTADSSRDEAALRNDNAFGF